MSTGSTQSFLSICSTRVFGRDRQRHDQHVDAGTARELDQLVDGAELGKPATMRRRAVVVAVVEDAADANVGVLLRPQRIDQGLARLAAADDDGAADQAALARPAAHQRREEGAAGEQQQHRAAIPGADPHARIHALVLGEKGDREHEQKDDGPGEADAAQLLHARAERANVINVGPLEGEDRGGGDGQYRRDVVPFEAVGRNDVDRVDQKPEAGDDEKIGDADESGEHQLRDGRGELLRGDG